MHSLCSFGHLMCGFCSGMSEHIAIALLLIHERAKGDDSFFSPYLDVLPTIEVSE